MSEAVTAAAGQVVLPDPPRRHTAAGESINDDGTIIAGYDFARPGFEDAAVVRHCHG